MARAAPHLPSVHHGACWDFVHVAKPSIPNAVSDAFRSVPCFPAAGNRQLFDQIPRTGPSHSFLFGHFENTCVCSSSPAGRAGGWGTSGLLTTPGSVASGQRLLESSSLRWQRSLLLPLFMLHSSLLLSTRISLGRWREKN